MGVAENRIKKICVHPQNLRLNTKNYCTFAGKNMALSHTSVKY